MWVAGIQVLEYLSHLLLPPSLHTSRKLASGAGLRFKPRPSKIEYGHLKGHLGHLAECLPLKQSLFCRGNRKNMAQHSENTKGNIAKGPFSPFTQFLRAQATIINIPSYPLRDICINLLKIYAYLLYVYL